MLDAVHKNESFIFLQLQALAGRTASPDVLQEGGYLLVASNPIPLQTKCDNNTSSPVSPPPRALTVEEVGEYVQLFIPATQNALLEAGFDGLEIHVVNRYLPDQFLVTESVVRVLSVRSGWACDSVDGPRTKVMCLKVRAPLSLFFCHE
jgi:2,4-dienoyl-CoA reductase-like NADH-dependent reductase (Old Yellow Enzyme family)